MNISNFCLIVGTQKGGTSSLFAYMAQHPQIAPSRIKETNFFSEDAQWEKGLDYYKSLWKDSLQQTEESDLAAGPVIALEASPNYTNSLKEASTVVQRVKTVSANVRFIYILRDPLQKIASMRKQGVYQGWYRPLLERETPNSVPPETLEPARYAEIIDKFVKEFSREKILLLNMENLRPGGKSAETMVQVSEFLGIDPTFQFSLQKIHNSQNSYREDTLWHVLRSSKSLDPLKTLFPDTLKNKARALLSKPISPPALKQAPSAQQAGSDIVPPLTTAQKIFIREALKNDYHRLENEYGLNVQNWKDVI